MASSALSSQAEDREVAAYHEAGHAVAAHHLGEPGDIVDVRILRTGTGYSGFIKLAPIPETERSRPENADRVRARLTVLMAGRAAEEKATGKDSPGSARLDIDEAHLLYLDAGYTACEWRTDEDGVRVHVNHESLYTEWLDEAREFMNKPERWAEVEAIKDKLLLCSQLSGAEAGHVIRGVRRSL